MKNRILLVLSTVITLLTFSCENFELDLQDNPNFPNVASAQINEIYQNIQIEFEEVHFVLEDQAGEVARMYNATSPNYGNATLPTVFDGLWISVYADLLPDIAKLQELIDENPIAADNDYNFHIGSAKVLQAYVLMEMVDVFGNIPYSETGRGSEELSPGVDSGADVYAAAGNLLDEAITLLTTPGNIKPAFDNFYNGDAKKWITLSKTIKLRAAYLTGDAEAFNSIISAGDYIDEEDEDFQYNYGSNRINPDSRHPRYVNQYEQADGDYMSNYYMWLLRADKLAVDGVTEIRDPRLRYYFYRKVNSSVDQPSDSFGCLLSSLPVQSAKPDEWNAVDPRLPYCYASVDGYTGRDHLNGSGIPADGAIRTAYGLYPMAGDFDSNEFMNTQNLGTTGGLGKGILPLILSSYVDFMRADMALAGGGAGDPRTLLISAVGKSLAKVRGFERLVPNKMASLVTIAGVQRTVQEVFAMSDADIAAYEATVGRLYDEAGNDRERRDVIIKEFYIAAYGNGLEAYNMYRKTGLPLNMEPPLQPNNAGDFPRSMRYANAFVDRNMDVAQKSEADKVFWDDGSTILR